MVDNRVTLPAVRIFLRPLVNKLLSTDALAASERLYDQFVSVSQFVTQKELNVLQVEPLIFTNIESQEMWIPIAFGGHPNYL